MAIPGLEEYFGVISGVVFLLPFSTVGLFTGKMTDLISKRALLLGLCSILWSSTTMIQAYYPNFYVFIAMRIILGILESFSNPLAYSLIRDMFPPMQRSTANSSIQSSIYLGSALSSLNIVLIDNLGWKQTYYIIGLFGIVAGVLTVLLVSEPERGAYN